MSAAAFDWPGPKKTDVSAPARRRPLAFEKERALGTPTSERFERITRLARRVCDVPVATIEIAGGSSLCTEPAWGGAGMDRLRFRKDVELHVHGRPVGVLRVADFVPRVLDGSQEEMLHELASLAEQQIGEGAQQRELAEENERLRTWAFVDPLTRLWNRRAIREIALREAGAARDHHQTVGLVLIDLDFFKRINDSHGHAAGDAVLQEVSARLRAAVRATDAVGRWGGEEFLVVMPECSLATALAASERLRQAIAEPIDVGGARLVVTASFGVAMHGGGDVTLDDAVHAADLALYRAKSQGRNRVAA